MNKNKSGIMGAYNHGKNSSNKIQCKHCGEIIESKNIHDFLWCKCGSCAVEGGKCHLSRLYKISPNEDFIELSQVEDNN